MVLSKLVCKLNFTIYTLRQLDLDNTRGLVYLFGCSV